MSLQPSIDREFAIEQFKQVRASLEERIKESNETIKYVLLSAAATAAWVSTSTSLPYSTLRIPAYLIPFVIIVFGALRSEGVRIQRRIHFDYLIRTERCLRDGHYGMMGFEEFRLARMRAYESGRWQKAELVRDRLRRRKKRWDPHVLQYRWLDERYVYRFFGVVFLVFAIVAILFGAGDPPPVVPAGQPSTQCVR